MYRTLEEEFFFTQKVLLKQRYTNAELYLHQYFLKKTKIHPANIIIINNYVFFFINNKEYFKAKIYLRKLRNEMGYKKIQIIRLEKTLLKFILSFFPDPYVHDIKLILDENNRRKIIHVGLLSYKERGIAIGRKGDYIKAINELFKNYITFEEYATFQRYKIPMEIRCGTISIFE